MKKLTHLVTAGLLSALIAGASFAGPARDCHQGKHHGGHKDRLIQQLDLSAEQKTAIAELRAAQREQRKSQRQLNKSNNWLAVTPDQANYEEQVQAYAKQKAAAVEAKILAESKMRAEVYALLTPEQQTQLAQLKEERQEQRAERRAKRKAAREERFNNRLESNN